MTGNRNATIFALLLLAPAVAYLLFIVAYPLVDTVILSFTNAALKPTYSWVGWTNYEKIFGGRFPEIIVRTFVWTFFSVSIKMIIGTFGAVLLNAAIPGRALFRVLTMPPWIIPIAIGVYMWGWMYNGQFGMISGLLQNFGIIDKPVAWLALGRTGVLGDHRHRRLDRRAAGDDLPAGRHAVDPARSLRGRLDRRRRARLPLPPHHHAADRAGPRDHVDAVADRHVQLVRHHLHPHRRADLRVRPRR